MDNTGNDTKSTIDKYFDGWRRKDVAAIEGVLSPTVSFTGPMLSTMGRANFIAAVNAILPLVIGINFRHLFENEDHAVAIYDFDCGGLIGVCRMAELLSVKGGLIQSSEIFFDARPFEEAMK
jgi:hypothetical protein